MQTFVFTNFLFSWKNHICGCVGIHSVLLLLSNCPINNQCKKTTQVFVFTVHCSGGIKGNMLEKSVRTNMINTLSGQDKWISSAEKSKSTTRSLKFHLHGTPYITFRQGEVLCNKSQASVNSPYSGLLDKCKMLLSVSCRPYTMSVTYNTLSRYIKKFTK